MSSLRSTINDVLTKARAMGVFHTVRVWNNQLAAEKAGQYQAYVKPAFFLELATDAGWETLGGGYASADLYYRMHIIHEFYDDQAGNFEQDLIVYDLRDAVVKEFNLYQPVGAGPMQKVREEPDYDHDNLYHYIIDFVANFTDPTAAPETIETEGPTGLTVTAEFIPPTNYLIQQ